MVKYRIISDIHSEFWPENAAKTIRMIDMLLPPLATDGETTLLLAGDTGSHRRRNTYSTLIGHLCNRFHEIVDIPGNHFWYGADHGIEGCGTPHVADNYLFGRNFSRYPTQALPIHACTLWSDFDRENPISMAFANLRMNDYRQIPKHAPQIVLQHHKQDLVFLKERVKPGHIVMTHHAPSFRSIAPHYATDKLGGSYASALDTLVEELQPALWIHGHIHWPSDYMIGNTRVICNPAGYINSEDTGYNPTLLVEA